MPDVVEHVLPLLPDNFTREKLSTLVRTLPRMRELPESQINRKINAVGRQTGEEQYVIHHVLSFIRVISLTNLSAVSRSSLACR